MDQKTMMEMMQKLATPSERHKKLDVLVGSWQAKGMRVTRYLSLCPNCGC